MSQLVGAGMVRQPKKTSSSKPKNITPVEVAELDSLLGPPPLFENDSEADYEALKARLKSAIKPNHAIEEIWVRDIIDLQWELLRLRRLRARYIDTSSHIGLKRILTERGAHYLVENFVTGWMNKDEEILDKIDKQLEIWGISMDDIDAYTLVHCMDIIERFDKLIHQIELRRNHILREIDRYREQLSRRFRMAIDGEETQANQNMLSIESSIKNG
jgi:hypothetical protein